MLGVAERQDALLGTRLLLVAATATEGRVEVPAVEALLQRGGQHQVGVAAAVGERRDAVAPGLLVELHPQVEAELACGPVAELDHLAEIPAALDVQQRERQRGRGEGLAGQVQQHRGILADRIEQHRPLELGRHLAEHVDRLGLERPQAARHGRADRRRRLRVRVEERHDLGRHPRDRVRGRVEIE